MNKNKKTKLARRQFLKDSSLATAAIGISYFSFGNWRAALAQAQLTGKPVLTEQNLNALIPKDRTAFKRFAADAKRDLPGFLQSRLTLTATQERELATLTTEDQSQVKKAIDLAEKEGVPLRVKIQSPRANLSSSERLESVQASLTNAPPPFFRLRIDVGLTRDPFGKVNGVYITVSKD